MFAAPSVSVAGSSPGQVPAKLSPSSTVSDPPLLGELPDMGGELLLDPQPARMTATTVAMMTDDIRKADGLPLRLGYSSGLTSCSRYRDTPVMNRRLRTSRCLAQATRFGRPECK